MTTKRNNDDPRWTGWEKANPLRHFHVPLQDGFELAVYAGVVDFEDDDGASYRVELDVSEDPAGVLVSGFTVRPAPGTSLTARQLHKVRMGELVRRAMLEIGDIVDEEHRKSNEGHWIRDADLDAAAPRRGRGRPATIDDDELQRVADIYNATPAGTTAAVASALGISESTARKRIWKARQAGFIEQTDTTRPKGQTDGE